MRSSLVIAPVPALLLLLAARTPAAQDDATGPAVLEADACALCHSNAPQASAMRDASGAPVAPYDLWRATMMANASRDPFWRATVAAERAATPARAEEIATKCLRCHAPMAELSGLDDHGSGSVLHALDCEGRLGTLAADGVSCSVCHGILPDGLGADPSFTGGFRLDPAMRLFGPHADPFERPMRMATGFTPSHGAHVSSSALCGTCHTLETESLDPAGEPTGHVLLEQGPYLEWRASAFRDEGPEPGELAASCQDCHMPRHGEDAAPIATRIARNPGGRDFPPVAPRDHYSRHLFVGGNTLVPALLRDHAEELRATAPREAFDEVLRATREQLEQRSARLALQDVRREGGRLVFEVLVRNLAGHKPPTGHPSRRAWLRVLVRGEAGALLFASGRTDEAGRIVDLDGQPLPSELAGGPIEPHRERVGASSEIAAFQAVMADAEGEPTFVLMRGASWLRDDRLLPRGWDPAHPDAARTAPIGVEGDGDFAAGSDRVRFEIDLPPGGRVELEAALLYQPLSARWAAELFRWEAAEVASFRAMYESADRSPVVLASARWRE